MPEPNLDHLIHYYKTAEYHVHSTPSFTLRIGIVSVELQLLYRQHHIHSAAFITAWNPYSQPLSLKENQQRQQILQQTLDAARIAWLLGVGSNAEKTWQEESLLALGIGKKNARELGERFQQNAIVWCGADAVPTLLMLS